jgi:hypothetical protein
VKGGVSGSSIRQSGDRQRRKRAELSAPWISFAARFGGEARVGKTEREPRRRRRKGAYREGEGPPSV